MHHDSRRLRFRSLQAGSLCFLGTASLGCYQPANSDVVDYYTGDAVSDDGTSVDDDGDGAPQGPGNPDNGGTDPDTGNTGVKDAGAPASPDNDAGTSTSGDNPAPTSLTFSVLTVSLGGNYAPRNVGAIWIEDGSGAFVKTLEVWARTRKRYLTTYLGATNDDITDAITSATLTAHRTHSVTWDLTDVSGATVPDGDYRLVMEITDYNGLGDSTSVSFTKGPAPQQLSPDDAAHFVDMSLSYE